jgi:DNA anti-recombination protein RmuC
MAVMARESWTDERLDDLKGSMNERFDAVDKRMNERFDAVDKRMNERFDAVDRRMDERFKQVDNEMKTGFARVDERFKEVDRSLDRVHEDVRELRVAVTGMQRVMTQSVIAICTLMTTGFLTLIGIAAF